MSAAAPGQFRLLLHNEFRLYLRSGRINFMDVGVLILVQMLLHAVALGLALVWRVRWSEPDTLTMMLAVGLVAMLLLMLSRAMAGAMQSLYTRGDLDLLLSSPVDRRAVLGVRMSTIAATVALEVALVVWPFANVSVLFGRFAWLKAYLLVPAMAMLATSIVLAVTLLSFRTIGPRSTRMAVQVLAVLVGVAMMLAIYLHNAINQGPGPTMVGSGMQALASEKANYRALLLVPANAVMHGFWPVPVFFAATAGLLLLAVHLTGERIIGALTAITGGTGRGSTRAANETLHFRGGFRTVIVLKELRLIARDPLLLAQILQQSLMVLPMTFMLWRENFVDLPLAWMSVIWLAAGLAAPLSWLTVIAEDAPDLLGSAPVTRATLVRAKLEAALLPTLPICLAPLFFLLGSYPWFALSTSLCACGAALTNAVLNMRDTVARRRDSFKTRHQTGGASGILEGLAMLIWFGFCALLIWIGTLLGWR